MTSIPRGKHVPAVVLVGLVALSSLGAGTLASASAVKVTVESPPSAPTLLTETGSSLLYPLWNLWAPAYHQQYPTVTIQTASTGSGVGISNALQGTANIGASDAYLSPVQLKANKNALNIPLAVSSQFVAYNIPGISGHVKLSGSILSQIYQGKITTWNAKPITSINKGVALPSTPIVTIHRADGSGDTFVFTQFLSKSDARGWGTTVQFGTTVAWPNIPGAIGATGNSGMLAACRATVGCVTYLGISYLAKAHAAGLGEAQLQNASGKFELPTAATIGAEAAGFANKTPANGVISMIYGSAGTGYPIVNYEYAIVLANQSSSTTAQAIRSVLEWAINPVGGNSSSYLSQVNFQPLPAKVVSQSVAQIKKIR